MIDQDVVVRAFREVFERGPDVVAHAPGRVNLMGEHTDYNGGFVFPAAINFGTCVAAARRADRTIRVIALDYRGEASSFMLCDIQFDPMHPWSNYVRGVLKILQETYRIGGADLLLTGDVPQGAGLSSSASLEIAVLKSISELYALDLSGREAAHIGKRAENEFVGCSCGIMDQLVSAMGKQGQALLLDCKSMAYEYHPISRDYQLVIVNSNVRRHLATSEYNLRREQCEEAARQLGVPSLRDADANLLSASRSSLPDVIYRRARHVVSENQRTLAMRDALAEADYSRLCVLMGASHESMKRDFEITVPQVDKLVDIIACELGGAGGVRMTGGGFGGCVLAIAPADSVADIRAAVEAQYFAQTGIRESLYVCTPEQGAFVR